MTSKGSGFDLWALVFDFDAPRRDHNPPWIARSVQEQRPKIKNQNPRIFDLVIHFTPSSDIFCNGSASVSYLKLGKGPSAKLSSAELAT